MVLKYIISQRLSVIRAYRKARIYLLRMQLCHLVWLVVEHCLATSLTTIFSSYGVRGKPIKWQVTSARFKVLWQHQLQKDKSHGKVFLGTTLNIIWLKGFNFGVLESVKYPFIVIIPRFKQTLIGSIFLGSKLSLKIIRIPYDHVPPKQTKFFLKLLRNSYREKSKYKLTLNVNLEHLYIK